MLTIILFLLFSELNAENQNREPATHVNVCNMTLCGNWFQTCIDFCTCDSSWCFCCAPCLVCLDNGSKWFDCCACYDLCK